MINTEHTSTNIRKTITNSNELILKQVQQEILEVSNELVLLSASSAKKDHAYQSELEKKGLELEAEFIRLKNYIE
ncbi:hypothetical protein [Candidatus Enterovibrio escicola]|uniref:hypothetical protein n=1 Tax=Candidatus Enterovibrio escicola TaxID=1927127 RepID=UPI001237A1D3|nr:hypothetical protein [Candidatus Enterovibrio escacola]